MKRYWLPLLLVLWPTIVVAQPPATVRHDRLGIVLYNFEGNVTQTGLPVTFMGDQVAASKVYFTGVQKQWNENSLGFRIIDSVTVYDLGVLPRPVGWPTTGGCLWNPNITAIGNVVRQAMADKGVPTDITLGWLFPPCPGDNLVRWGVGWYVQNQGPKVSTVYGLWWLELNNGFPWYTVWRCVDAGVVVPISNACTNRQPWGVGIGGDPVATGLMYHSPLQVKRRLGWLTDQNRRLLTAPGDYIFDLPPMETKIDGPMYALVMAEGRAFYLEWRQRIGIDKGLPPGLDLGLLIRMQDNSLDLTPLNTKDNPVLLVGQTLRLSPSNVTVSLLSITPGVKATVEVVIP